MKYKTTYYWYGEYKVGKTVLPSWATWECYRTDVSGVSCYSSKDLLNWYFEGVVLKSEPDNPESDLHPSKVIERPKVVYNAKTGKFVMWVHAESADYSKAAAGVAVSDSPTGPFTYLGSFRPNNSMSRDQTLFVDDDGTCYQFCSSENNQTLHINKLTDDYLRPEGTYVRRFIDKAREAPAVFKYKGKYYMLSSGCTGWDPNEAELAVADSIMGEWTVLGNPCVGLDADKTFYGQSTFVIPVNAKKGKFIASIWYDDDRYWKVDFIQDGKVYPMKRVTRRQNDWNAVSFFINENGRGIDNASYKPKTLHYWTVEAPSGNPAQEKNWEIRAVQTIPDSGVTHVYSCRTLQTGYSGLGMDE